MIHSVIDNILPDIETLSFIDKISGISYPMQKEIIDKDGRTIVKQFPVCPQTPSTCASGDYLEMTPDSDLMSVVYFESTPETITENGCSDVIMTEATVTLVAWFNLILINQSLRSGESLLNLIIRAVNGTHNQIIDGTHVHSVFTLQNINFRDPAIFSRYESTYKEANKQYLIYPRDFGAATFNVQMNYALCDEEPTIDPGC